MIILNKFSNKRLTPNAQHLRKNMTKEERHLWYDFLKSLPLTFHRQKVVGGYIVDFYCADKGLVIELDGNQHYEQTGVKKDEKRDADLAQLGLEVVRYSNLEINNQFESVCADILLRLGLINEL